MNYGNHDYENNLMVGSEENQDCILTQSEKKFVDIVDGKNITLQMFQTIPFSESTLVIMIDTTMYDMDDNESYRDCYQYAVINGTRGHTFETAKDKQVEFMSSVVDQITENTYSNIVIMGHHPIINYKIKEAKDKKPKDKEPKANEGKDKEPKDKKEKTLVVNTLQLDELAKFLYEELFLKLKEKVAERTFSYYYVCADLHQYQAGNITIGQGGDVMNIRQYIAGTGGAKKDTYDKELIKKIDQSLEKKIKGTDINCTYNMSQYDIEHSRAENGFLIGKENRDKTLHFQFYDVKANQIIDGNELTASMTGGYKKSTKKINKKFNKKFNKKINNKTNKKQKNKF